MTTLFVKKAQCAVCGSKTDYTGIGSTNAFGYPDLDTRPPEMARSTIFAWVQRCPECGYCASDVSEAPPEASAVVRSPKYREQLDDTRFPELANSFLCKALIDESVGNYAAAAWALIHAAWTCDDEEMTTSARECRNRAVDMVLKAGESGQQFAEEQGVDIAILSDLMRRAGRFTEAQQLIATKRPEIAEDIILKILGFQESLIAGRDEACHTIGEALREEE